MKSTVAILPGYQVEHIDAESHGPIVCDCGWRGQLTTAKPIETCVLSAGDPSPCGRCPKCDQLVYVTPNDV